MIIKKNRQDSELEKRDTVNAQTQVMGKCTGRVMVNLLNLIKALVVSVLISGLYTLYSTTSSYQEELAREGQDVGKIEALMHYSSLVDVWSRVLSGWFHLSAVCFISCVFLMFWLNLPDESSDS